MNAQKSVIVEPDQVERYFIKHGYRSRLEPQYFQDSLVETSGIIHQPFVYSFAQYLAQRFDCSTVIDVGCGRAQKLVQLHPQLELIGIDFGSNIEFCRRQYPFGKWIEWNIDSGGTIPLEPDVIRNSVVVCADVIEHLVDPTTLGRMLKFLMGYAPVGIISTHERDLVRGSDDVGPPGNPSHVREWNLSELEAFLSHSGLRVAFSGLTFNNNHNLQKKTSAIVLENNFKLGLAPPPSQFRVVAIMTSYNEADIIRASIGCLVRQGISVYLIDNWSTDNTCQLASEFLGHGLIAMENFPPGGPARYYEWAKLLRRVEEVSRTIDAHWIIHHDVDEVRVSPWSGVDLRSGIYHVDQSGYTAIDHTCLNFSPTDNLFSADADYEEHFRYFDFGKRPGHFNQIKTWKRTQDEISLAESGGHEVKFRDRKVYPFKFLLKHYPIRSQHHGERKIFQERKMRWAPEERAKGWHTHYDQTVEGQSFLSQAVDLKLFDENFYEEFLFERLSGISVLL